MYRPSRAPGQLQPQPHQAAGGARLRRSDDPLAELARLIGQEDPFKEFDAAHQSRARVNGNGNGRSNGNGAAYHAPAVAPERRADRYTNGNGSGYSGGTSEAPHRNGRDDLTPPRQPVSRQAQPAPARPAAHTEEQYPAPRPRFPVTAQNPRTANLRAHDEPERPSPRPSQRIPGNQYAEPLPAHEAYADEEVRAPRRAEAPIPRSRRAEPQRAEGYAPESAPRHARGRPQTAPYQDDYRRGQERDEYDPQYDDDAYLADEAEDLYEDAHRTGRGIGFWVVSAIVLASLIAVAFLGVFAYRTIFNNQPTRAAVVTKSNAPTKVEPKATPQTVNPSNKPIQDRLGAPEPTQIMRREEAPADVSRQNQNPQLPAATKNNPAFTPPPAQQPVQQQQVPQQQNPVVEQQPKRVKTIPLRSDGIPQSAAPQQQQQNSGPMQLQATPQVQDQPETQSIPQNRSNTNSSVPPPAPQRTNVASLGTPAPATGTGNYIVQVASHKTPEEAQTAWATLRQQYSTIFGARNADIRKVDLGDRGTFYRAMVGPMNREQANALCQNLKTQGAGCIVQTRN